MNVTPRQFSVLKAIHAHNSQLPYGPSLREVAKQLNLNSTTVYEHADNLIRKGALTKTPNVARSIRLTDDGTAFVEAWSNGQAQTEENVHHGRQISASAPKCPELA